MRGLIEEIVARFERKELILVEGKLIKTSIEQAQKLYETHKRKAFYQEPVSRVTPGSIFLMALERLKESQ
jgi:nucleoside-diphosphate kinase